MIYNIERTICLLIREVTIMKRETPANKYMSGSKRREQILEISAELFAERSYDATSVKQIAEKCGCSAALIIKIFKTKENIYTALLEKYAEICAKPILHPEDIPEFDDPMQKLRYVYDFLIRTNTEGHKQMETIKLALSSRGACKSSVLDAERNMQDISQEILLPIMQECKQCEAIHLDPQAAAMHVWMCTVGDMLIHREFPRAQKLSFDEITHYILKI